MSRWAVLALLLLGCAARPLARPTPLVHVEYVDEAETIRAALDDAWLATAFIDVTSTADGKTGSGVLVEARDVVAFVLTAEHVMHTDTERAVIWVSFPDGKKFVGRIKSADYRRDLALVEVLGHVGVAPIRLASETPRRLARVWSLGAPDGEWGHIGDGRWGRLFNGRVAKALPLLRTVTGGFFFEGMSGGPVVDERGQLVGIIDTVHLADAEGETDEDNDPQVRVPQMGGAVDWRDVRDFLRESGVR